MSEYKKVDQSDVEFFISTLDKERVLTHEPDKKPYGKDYTEDFLFVPEVV
jgi:hypothetical protein